jgi:hypothetical protein
MAHSYRTPCSGADVYAWNETLQALSAVPKLVAVTIAAISSVRSHGVAACACLRFCVEVPVWRYRGTGNAAAARALQRVVTDDTGTSEY